MVCFGPAERKRETIYRGLRISKRLKLAFLEKSSASFGLSMYSFLKSTNSYVRVLTYLQYIHFINNFDDWLNIQADDKK